MDEFVFRFQDGLEQQEVAFTVLGNKDRDVLPPQWNFRSLHNDLFRLYDLGGQIRNFKPKCRAFALTRRFDAYRPVHLLDDSFADRESKSIARHEIVQFDETLEKSGLALRRDPHAGVFHEKVNLVSAQFVSENNASALCELSGIGDQVDQHLRQTVGFGTDDTIGRTKHKVEYDFGLQAQTLRTVYRTDQIVEVRSPVYEVERIGFDLSQIEYVADQLQQQLVIVLDNVHKLLFLLFVLGGEQQA